MRKVLIILGALFNLALYAQVSNPNILFIMVDDLGWTDLSTDNSNLGNGSEYYETPNVDLLASKGMSFPYGYSAGSNCAPTRASLYSGQYSPRTRCYTVKSTNRGGKKATLKGPKNHEYLDLSIVTYAEVLKQAGYATAHFGKWHAGGDKHGGGLPDKQGFDLNIGGSHIGGTTAGFFADKNGAFIGKKAKMPNLGPNGKAGQWLDDRVTDECLKWLDGVKEKPFLANFCFYAVHSPITSPKDDKAHFNGKKPTKGHKSQTYAGFVKSYDDNIGRLVNYLEKTDDPRNPRQKLISNTVIIFTSDNGGVGGWVNPWNYKNYTSQAPLKNGKGSMYEGGIRVPYIVRWDGHVKPNTINKQSIITTDIYPTFAELAKQPLPNNQPIDGESLVSLIQGKKKKLERENLFFHFPAYLSGRQTPVSVIKRGNFKLMYWYETGSWEMYDVVNDMSETENIVKEHPEVFKNMAESLINWLKETKAEYPKDKSNKPVKPTLTSIN